SQLRYPGEGRHYYEKKIAEGKTSKEAIRALKRRISDVVYRRLRADAQRIIRWNDWRVREDTQGRLLFQRGRLTP
ncbi:MAG: hypothetical protein ACR2NT_11505, partial [Acidimicrobiia bacterium]